MAGTNRLAQEKSPYLRGAAHQPVDWYPWGPEAFERARREDKPVLLDVGAAWCHWCHVIDRESYEDPEVARIINEHFVAVKVDRDERPDVDARYQQAVAALSGQGGWPLTAFLTPEGKVFYGGTYFPPKEAFGRPSFKRVLMSVAGTYRTEKESVLGEAENLHRAFAHRHVEAEPKDLAPKMLESAADQIGASFDPSHGGFGTAPKFPHPGTMEFLLSWHWRTRDDYWRAVVVKTLEGMARGGVYDQLGGGFHRYSVDQRWIVPHFEKMAYDNAGLLLNYVHGWQLTGAPLFRQTAEGIVRWVDAALSDRERGGFFGSQDADMTLEDDGDYYTWTLKELQDAVDGEEARVLALRYNVGEIGEMRETPDRNVLFVDKEPEEIARIVKAPVERIHELLATGRAKLLAARGKRKTPLVDRTIYSNWNGMFVSAYLEAGSALGLPGATAFARRTLDRLLEDLYVPAEGFHHQWAEGRRTGRGLLDDQVQMLNALLDGFEHFAEPRYLAVAEEVAGLLVRHFRDRQVGGFFDTAEGIYDGAIVPALATRRKPLEDNPTPSANGISAIALGRLHHLTGKEEYRREQEETLRALAPEALRHGGVYCGTFFQALDLFLNPPAQAVIVGARDDPVATALQAAALSVYSPGKSVLHMDPASGGFVPEPVKPMLDAPAAKAGAVAFVCRGMSCAPPTDDPERVRALLASPG